MNLTPEEIAIYRKEIETSKQFGRKTILAGVSDVEKLLNEVEAIRFPQPESIASGTVVKVAEQQARILGTDSNALHAVLVIEGDNATVALVGDNCLATVPVRSLVPATVAEMSEYVTSNAGWDHATVKLWTDQ